MLPRMSDSDMVQLEGGNLRAYINRSISEGPDEQLEREVRSDLSFLFDDFGAKVVTNHFLPGIGNSILIIETRNLRIQFMQSFGQVRSKIAPSHMPDDWKDLTLALMAVKAETKFDSKSNFASLQEQGEWLKQEIPRLNDAFSRSQYAETSLRIKQAAWVGVVTFSTGSRKPPSLSLRLLRPPLKLLARLIRFAFRPQRKRLALEPLGSDEGFLIRVKEDWSFLFREHSAKVSSSGYFYSFGNACVTLAAENLRIRVIRDRGDILTEVASDHAPWHWYPMDAALSVATTQEDSVSSPSLPWPPAKLTDRVQAHFSALVQAFSVESYPSTRRKLSAIAEARQADFIRRMSNPPPAGSSGSLSLH